jgi:hypothetical protein
VRASCVRGAAPECVFAFQVDERSELRAALETSDFDGSLTLFDASGGAPKELRCVDDLPQGDFHHARLESALPPGSYMLVVDGANGQAGEFELFTELEPLPSLSDLCASARPLIPGVALRESTRGGSNAFTATCACASKPSTTARSTCARSAKTPPANAPATTTSRAAAAR